MKTLFIEARANVKVNLDTKLSDKLPNNICLASAVQFVHLLEDIKKQLEKNNKKVTLFSGRHTKHQGQMLGCDIKNNVPDTEAFLYIGDGLFHPKALQFQTEKPVFTYNPFSKELTKLKRDEIELILKKQKANYVKFLHSDKIGVVVTIKPGQKNIKKGKILDKKFPDKTFYYFLTDTIDFNELENYPFIQCWVNTACPRIGLDDTNKIKKPIINMEQLAEDLLF